MLGLQRRLIVMQGANLVEVGLKVVQRLGK